MSSITTTIDIDAPPKRVWDVLTDFDAYPDWNPFIRSIAGSLVEGEVLQVSLGASGKKPMQFAPVVTDVAPARKFAWLGKLGISGVFDGHHHFELEETTTGTHVTQHESFKGVLAPILLAAVRSSTQRGFEEMNRALKERAEAA